jgi:hypothetical protein
VVLAQNGFSLREDGKYHLELSYSDRYITSYNKLIEDYQLVTRFDDAAEIFTASTYESNETSFSPSTNQLGVREVNVLGLRQVVGGVNSGKPRFYPAGTINGGIPVPPGSTVIQVQDEGGFLGTWVYPPSYTGGGTVLGSNPQYQSVIHYRREQQGLTSFEELTAGASDNLIFSQGYALVDAGAGDDTIIDEGWYPSFPDLPGGIGSSNRFGSFLYGNAGKDRIFGGDANDVVVGGTGDDILDGGADADTYILFSGDGADVASDTGDEEFDYKNRYYNSLGIANWQFREALGGKWYFCDECPAYDNYEDIPLTGAAFTRMSNRCQLCHRF